MRSFLIIMMCVFFAQPVLAGGACHLEGPHNCMESNEDELIARTKSSIHQMQLTQQHAFKTENDTILENFARSHAQLSNPQTQPSYPLERR